ncbi:MAG: ABC transporter ATP-binding protein [Gammaproteobacteria bacterium]|nr:ABC transporter ATP-binding protein [Gammaproteobacteria bacterium]
MLLETRNLVVTIAGKQVCRGLELAIEAGQCWGLLGGNGVGKTTLLHTLAGLRTPAQGTVLLEGKPLGGLSRREAARRIGMLFQTTADAFPATVLETTLTGRHPHLERWRWETAQDLAMARAALHRVDLDGMEARLVATLSGGERQRLALATVLTQDPVLYLLDEPTHHLDLHHQIMLLELLTRPARENGKALLMVLHDVNLAARFCDHLLLLFGAGETLQGPTDKLLNEIHLQRLYRHPIVTLPGPDGRRAYLPG